MNTLYIKNYYYLKNNFKYPHKPRYLKWYSLQKIWGRERLIFKKVNQSYSEWGRSYSWMGNRGRLLWILYHPVAWSVVLTTSSGFNSIRHGCDCPGPNADCLLGGLIIKSLTSLASLWPNNKCWRGCHYMDFMDIFYMNLKKFSVMRYFWDHYKSFACNELLILSI